MRCARRLGEPFKDSRGSLVVEAAILLPVFLVAILTLGYFIKGLYIQETVHAICVDQAVKLSVENATSVDLASSLTYGIRVNQRIKETDSGTTFTVSVPVVRDGENNSVMVFYRIPINFPVLSSKGFTIGETVVVRSWTGKTTQGIPLSFTAMEQEDNSEQVYVFPRAGEKYHKENCRYVDVYPIEYILTNRVKSNYDPCKLCDAKGLENGAVVYCFEKSGGAYHRYDCVSVERYVVEMSVEDAASAGYVCCLKCY